MRRAPLLRGSFSSDELIVDCFAGAGGASKGIEAALGRPPDFAINHDPVALAVHQANHPQTRHIISDIFEIDPSTVCGSRRVGVLWASPDCTHHSRAKGGKPRSSKRRALASVVIVWAREVGPRIIVVENVEEFAEWGPLGPDGKPDKTKAGRCFRSWCAKLVELGYELEFRTLVAADYGTPTLRKRLFLIARRDGAPIIWPEASHGPARSRPWRSAAECINWSHPVPSIFGRRKPHAVATHRRVAAGIRRFVLETADPFILPVTHQGDHRVHSIREPVRTVTAAHRGELALCVPTLIQTGYGERTGQAPRILNVQQPLGTVVAGGAKHGLVVPVIVPHYGGSKGHPTAPRSAAAPVPTVTTKDHTSLVAAWLTTYYGTSKHGAPLSAPMPTVLAGGGRGGGHAALTAAFLRRHLGEDCSGIVTIGGAPFMIADVGLRMLQPDELARAQGLQDYDLSAAPTKGAQIALVGNSVCPEWAEAIVSANAMAA